MFFPKLNQKLVDVYAFQLKNQEKIEKKHFFNFFKNVFAAGPSYATEHHVAPR